MAHLSALPRDAIVLGILIVAFTGFQRGVPQLSGVFTYVPWQLSIGIFAVVIVLFGAGAFLSFKSAYSIRFVLTIAIPVLTQLVLERFWGSDPAYPGLTVLLAVPFSGLFLLGAV